MDSLSAIISRHGYENLCALKDLVTSFPKTMLEKDAQQTVASTFSLTIPEVIELLDSVAAAAPFFLEELIPHPHVYHLTPPIKHCLRGCHTKAFTPKLLINHRQPTEVTVYDLRKATLRGFEYIYRCTNCKNRYSYSSYYDKELKKHFLYKDEPQLLRVNNENYWSRPLADLLINSIIHGQITYEGFAESLKATFGWKNFDRRLVSDAFHCNEIENELRFRGVQTFGFDTETVNCDSVKAHLELLRQTELYYHECGQEGTKRGCPYLHIMDGVWKHSFRHCNMPMKVETTMEFVNLPQVCSNEPVAGRLYCSEHLSLAVENSLPLTKKDLRAKTTSPSTPTSTTFDEELLDIADDLSHLKIENTPSCLNKTSVAPWCKKNDGRMQKVGSWSRGYFFFVHACGQVSSFSPLYKSESLSQAYVLTLEWLSKRLAHFPYPLSQFFLAYDNMCNFGRLKALQQPLPPNFPQEYQTVWTDIRLIIDGLHLKNHKRASCSQLYNPSLFAEAHPEATEANTMAAEQTFSYLTKFKKQVNAMNKLNQLFFLHRVVVRRNNYLKECMLRKQPPVRIGQRSAYQRAGL